MILHFDIDIKDLVKAGKSYPWPRPDACPCCGGRLWGHGYTRRYFSGNLKHFWLKRYRCIECHAVHTLRPKTHWRRFQFPLATIIESLRTKISDNFWLKGSRQRQEYWMRGLQIQLERHGSIAIKISLQHLRSLLTKNIIVATHSLRWFQMMMQGPLTCVPEL